jgi:APA family basic amino acid/polyamine antiporter
VPRGETVGYAQANRIEKNMTTEPTLKRALSLPLITFYGLGTIIGAGIYVLIGEVAARAGLFTPIAFLVAAVIATFTALSYAELSSRLPRSGGEAIYIQAAFHRRRLSMATGWGVVAIGVVSSATLANGIVGYLNLFVPIPAALAVGGLVVILGLVAAWGITESVWLATLTSLLEIGGLIYVLISAGGNLADLPSRWHELLPPFSGAAWSSIFVGAFLAFYAFIGFEDMVNVAEEVVDAPRQMPRAIIIALLVSTLLYLGVALVAVLAMPVERLAASPAPLAAVLTAAGHESPLFIGAISLVAVVNGALIQIIMASRVLYGMGHAGLAAAALAKVHPRTRTPLRATALVTAAILILALWLPLATLAQMASFVTLSIFAAVHLALLQLKRQKIQSTGTVAYPIWVPAVGAAMCLIFIAFQAYHLS